MISATDGHVDYGKTIFYRRSLGSLQSLAGIKTAWYDFMIQVMPYWSQPDGRVLWLMNVLGHKLLLVASMMS
jgi:hypothetical protein